MTTIEEKITKQLDETINRFESLSLAELKALTPNFLLALQNPHSFYKDFSDDDVQSVHLYLQSRGIKTELKPRKSRRRKAVSVENRDFNDAFKNHYYDHLPHNPYCTSDLRFGTRIRVKHNAISYTHVQHNQPIAKYWIVLDYDKSDVEQRLQDERLPQPNLVVINPENGHAHLFFALRNPVFSGDAARLKPLRYLAAIEYSLCKKWGADVNYSGLISKNPLHENWLTKTVRAENWGLGELAQYLTLESKPSAEARLVGLGRNCTLFELLRFWSYDSVLEYRVSFSSSYEAWSEAVLRAAEGFNTFPEHLPLNEVAATARSVAKWVWWNYTKRLSDEEFSQRQAERGRRGGKASGITRASMNEDKRVQARLLAGKGLSQRAIAQELEVSAATINSWLKQ